MLLENAFHAFLIEQQIRGNSPRTLEYYGNCIKPLLVFLGPDFEVAKLGRDDLYAYAVKLHKRGISANSVKTYVKGIKAFLSWMYQEEYITNNLSEKFRLPKAKRKVIDVLTDSEIKALFGSFDVKSAVGLRDYCMCALMLDSGLRKSEVVSLPLSHLHLAEGYLLVDGKGGKQRIVPIGLHTQKHLLKYVAMRPASVRHDALFLTKNNTPITACVLERMFKKLKKDLLTPRIRAHLLRHTFATRYLENGGNIYALQQILGHASLDMVKKYVHLTTHKNVSSFMNYSPLDNLR